MDSGYEGRGSCQSEFEMIDSPLRTDFCWLVQTYAELEKVFLLRRAPPGFVLPEHPLQSCCVESRWMHTQKGLDRHNEFWASKTHGENFWVSDDFYPIHHEEKLALLMLEA